MAELTGKAVSELPAATTAQKADLIAVSQSGASKKMTLETLMNTSLGNVTQGTITRLTTQTGTFQQLNCIKIGNFVQVAARAYGMIGSTVTADLSYFQLPAGFRPKESVYVIAFITTQANERITTLARITPNGEVKCFEGSTPISAFTFSATFVV